MDFSESKPRSQGALLHVYNVVFTQSSSMRKRIGSRMKSILRVLKVAEKPLTITEIIIRIMNLTSPEHPHYASQMNLASAIAHESIGGMFCPVHVTIRKTGKDYSAVGYADLLYRTYGRAMKTLKKYGKVVNCGYGYVKTSFGSRIVRAYKLKSRRDLKP